MKPNFGRKFRVFLVVALTAMTLMPTARGIEYTEELYEVTDEGVFDESGNWVDIRELELEEAVPEAPVPAVENPVYPSGDSFEEYRETLINAWGGKKAFTEKRLQEIRNNLEAEIKRFDELQNTVAEAEDKIAPLEAEIKTLQDQVNLYNEQIRLTREKIRAAEKQIAERELALRKTREAVQVKEVAFRAQAQVALDYINLLYQEEAEYVDLYSDGTSTLKLLLASNTVSENLLGKEYVAVMEGTGRRVFHQLESQLIALREKQAALLLGQTKLNRLYTSLAQEKEILEETRQSKKELLAQTQEQKTTYEELLEQSIQQQLDSALAIQNMKDNIDYIESKLDLLDQELEKVQNAAPPAEGEMPAIPLPRTPDGEKFVFDWPVAPNKITAYFHDENYPKRWGIHQAIDIRARQFTEIRAPANGYVVEARDNGFGYSYIILAHKGNLVTVYGHAYEIRVSPGMLVQKGQVIGMTGGTPGTRGAGLQTTGPHLHFEVHYKGEPKDPLEYLPVFELPIEYIPEKYLTVPKS